VTSPGKAVHPAVFFVAAAAVVGVLLAFAPSLYDTLTGAAPLPAVSEKLKLVQCHSDATDTFLACSNGAHYRLVPVTAEEAAGPVWWSILAEWENGFRLAFSVLLIIAGYFITPRKARLVAQAGALRFVETARWGIKSIVVEYRRDNGIFEAVRSKPDSQMVVWLAQLPRSVAEALRLYGRAKNHGDDPKDGCVLGVGGTYRLSADYACRLLVEEFVSRDALGQAQWRTAPWDTLTTAKQYRLLKAIGKAMAAFGESSVEQAHLLAPVAQ
jgi:hypothetical protein